jgi:uncharacterized membrane protein (DUF441 family)
MDLIEGKCPIGAGENSSCSACVAFRMKTIFAISVTVEETWLAAASSKLTGDMPELVACVLVATTKLLKVASARSLRVLKLSKLTSVGWDIRSK